MTAFSSWIRRFRLPVRLGHKLFPDSPIERFVYHTVLVVTAVTAVLYIWLPQAFPIHFNRNLAIDGTMGKPFGPFILPLLSMALLYISRSISRATSFFFPAIEPFVTAVQALLPISLVVLQLVLLVMLVIR